MFYINGYFLKDNYFVGLHRFSYEILIRLDKIIKDEDITLLIPDNIKKRLSFNNIKILELKIPKGKNMDYWKKVIYPKYVIDHNGISIDLAFAQQTKKIDICGIFDCISFLYPQNFPTFKNKISRLFNLRRISISGKKSKVIVTLSNSAKKEILNTLKLNERKIKIVGCGWEHIMSINEDKTIFSKMPKEIVSNGYYFSLGSKYYHKNINWILKMAEKNPHKNFVITGMNNTQQTNLKNVYFTGYLRDEEIKALFSSCELFIQPSLDEGFGIPPLEAMALSKRVLVSSIPVFKEIFGDSVNYFDLNCSNFDFDALPEIDTCKYDNVLTKYSWENAAKQYYEILVDYNNNLGIVPGNL